MDDGVGRTLGFSCRDLSGRIRFEGWNEIASLSERLGGPCGVGVRRGPFVEGSAEECVAAGQADAVAHDRPDSRGFRPRLRPWKQDSAPGAHPYPRR